MSKKKSKVKRNDLCPCGSGEKYKNCCLSNDRKSINSTASGDKMDIPSINKMRKKIENAEKIKKIADLNAKNPHLPPNIKNQWEKCSNSASEVIKFKEDIELPGYFNNHFSELGWIAYDNVEIMRETVHLADNGKFDEAEQVLIDYYSPKSIEIWIEWLDFIDEFKLRMKLIKKAFEDYKAERYYSCILVLITVIDGVVFENKETGNKGFFGEENALKTADDIVTHVTGLPALQKLLSSPRTRKNIEEITIPYRNGIVHGRDLEYDNIKVAAKLWDTLFALKKGIIAIKKDKDGKKENKSFNLQESLKNLNENQIRDKLIKDYEPRSLKFNIDYPESEKPSEYDIGTPERKLVEFFEHWLDQKPNYGYMGEMLDSTFIDGQTFDTVAGKLSREIFKSKKLLSFKILEIVDKTIYTCKIKTKLTIQKNEEKLTSNIDFELIYEDVDGKHEIRGMPSCSWKIMNGLEQIKNL